jgi:hypothetical protein
MKKKLLIATVLIALMGSCNTDADENKNSDNKNVKQEHKDEV